MKTFLKALLRPSTLRLSVLPLPVLPLSVSTRPVLASPVVSLFTSLFKSSLVKWGSVASICLLSEIAHAGLMLYPTRVTFEGRTRSSTVELINNGTTPETYRLAFVNRRMTEKGDIVVADAPRDGELFAEQLLRFSPRQVTLQPGQSQTVRLMLRKPKELNDGEYRSHLQFNRVADAAGASNIENITEIKKGGISFKLTALVGMAIPVIVRHGDLSQAADIQDMRLVQGSNSKTKQPEPQLHFTLARTGNTSTYGNVLAQFIPNDGGEPVTVGNVKGVSVYVPNPHRRVILPLRLPKGKRLNHGRLQLTYTQAQPAKRRGKKATEGSVLAQGEIAVTSPLTALALPVSAPQKNAS